MVDVTSIPGLFEGILIIIALSVLCGGWVAFQMWINKQDPDKPKFEAKGCGCHTTKAKGRKG